MSHYIKLLFLILSFCAALPLLSAQQVFLENDLVLNLSDRAIKRIVIPALELLDDPAATIDSDELSYFYFVESRDLGTNGSIVVRGQRYSSGSGLRLYALKRGSDGNYYQVATGRHAQASVTFYGESRVELGGQIYLESNKTDAILIRKIKAESADLSSHCDGLQKPRSLSMDFLPEYNRIDNQGVAQSWILPNHSRSLEESWGGAYYRVLLEPYFQTQIELSCAALQGERPIEEIVKDTDLFYEMMGYSMMFYFQVVDFDRKTFVLDTAQNAITTVMDKVAGKIANEISDGLGGNLVVAEVLSALASSINPSISWGFAMLSGDSTEFVSPAVDFGLLLAKEISKAVAAYDSIKSAREIIIEANSLVITRRLMSYYWLQAGGDIDTIYQLFGLDINENTFEELVNEIAEHVQLVDTEGLTTIRDFYDVSRVYELWDKDYPQIPSWIEARANKGNYYADVDGDCYSNTFEVEAGTDPNDVTSYPEFRRQDICGDITDKPYIEQVFVFPHGQNDLELRLYLGGVSETIVGQTVNIELLSESFNLSPQLALPQAHVRFSLSRPTQTTSAPLVVRIGDVALETNVILQAKSDESPPTDSGDSSAGNTQVNISYPNSQSIFRLGTWHKVLWSQSGEEPDEDYVFNLHRSGQFIAKVAGRFSSKREVDWLVPSSLAAGSGYHIEMAGKDSGTFYARSSSFRLSTQNTAPYPVPASFSTTPLQPVVGSLSAQDAEDDNLEFSLTEGPSSGLASITDSGLFSYQPADGYVGEVVVGVRVSDGELSTDFNVRITISELKTLDYELLWEKRVHVEEITGLESYGSYLVSASYDDYIKIVSLNSGQVLKSLNTGESVTAMGAGEGVAVIGHSNEDLIAYKLPTLERKWHAKDIHQKNPKAIVVGRTGVFSAAGEDIIHQPSLDSGAGARFQYGSDSHEDDIWILALSAVDSNIVLYSGSKDAEIIGWKYNGAAIHDYVMASNVTALTVSPFVIYGGNSRGEIRSFVLRGSRRWTVERAHNSRVTDLDLMGPVLVSSGGNEVSLWVDRGAAALSKLATLKSSSASRIVKVAVSGEYIVSADEIGYLRVWGPRKVEVNSPPPEVPAEDPPTDDSDGGGIGVGSDVSVTPDLSPSKSAGSRGAVYYLLLDDDV